MSQSVHASAKPRPRISPDNRPFWEGCRARRLLLPFCTDCGKAHLPPGPVCPHCFSDDLAWRESSGLGTVSSWTIVHKVWFPAFAADVPYNVIQVELEEGPRLTASLRGADRPPRVGEAVRVDFEPMDDEITLPVFRPA